MSAALRNLSPAGKLVSVIPDNEDNHVRAWDEVLADGIVFENAPLVKGMVVETSVVTGIPLRTCKAHALSSIRRRWVRANELQPQWPQARRRPSGGAV